MNNDIPKDNQCYWRYRCCLCDRSEDERPIAGDWYASPGLVSDDCLSVVRLYRNEVDAWSAGFLAEDSDRRLQHCPCRAFCLYSYWGKCWICYFDINNTLNTEHEAAVNPLVKNSSLKAKTKASKLSLRTTKVWFTVNTVKQLCLLCCDMNNGINTDLASRPRARTRPPRLETKARTANLSPRTTRGQEVQ